MANFMLTKSKDTVPAKVQTENKSENADEYFWDFGDGNTSSEESPEHEYSLSGKYTVTLTAKKGGKTNTSSEEIFFNAPTECKVLIKTNMGNMTIQLHDDTPGHRDNFLKLANEGFYNDLLFHRVINGFMLQGGDPNSKGADADARLGSGGPGYTIPAEFNSNLLHYKGAVAAARTGDQVNPEKKSSGCQFYIVQGSEVKDQTLDRTESSTGKIYTDEQREKYKEVGGAPFLDHNYTVFGQVVDGFDIIDKIAKVSTNASDRPLEDVKILEMIQIK